MKEVLFMVAKIDKTRSNRNWGTGKVYLYPRLLDPNEKKYLNDVVSSKVMTGPRAWDLNIGDVIGCMANGSIDIDIPNGLRHIKRFKGKTKTTLNFWLPVRVYPSVKNLIITDEGVGKYGLAKDGSLVDSTFTSSRALPGEEWECLPLEISPDNKIVWYPLKRLSKVTNELRKTKDGEYTYCIQEISGDIVLSEAMVNPEIIHTHPEAGIIRMEIFFPIDRYETIETENGVIPTKQIPGLAGMVVIEKKINEEDERAITNYNYMDSSHITGYYSLLDGEKVDTQSIERVEA